MAVLTRIKNNQITDSSILANTKVVPGSIVGSLFNANLTVASDVTITGNLTVQGASSYLTVASTNTYVNDPLIVLNNAFTGSNSYDIGLIFNRGNQISTALIWNEVLDQFELTYTTETGTSYTAIDNSGFANIKVGNLIVNAAATFGSISTTGDLGAANLTLTGDAAVNGGDLTTSAATFNLVNTDATTVNFAGAATTLIVGATTGVANIRNATTNILGNATVGGTLGVTGHVTLEGVTSTGATGSDNLVFSTSPVLTTPNIGTPSFANLTNATDLPISTGVSGLAAGVATFLATPSSSNLITAVTDETGSGNLVFSDSPVLTTPNIGTPSFANLTNATDLPISTGVSGLGANVATFLATPSSSNLLDAITDETGTGSLVFATSPTLNTSIVAGSASFDLLNTTATTVNAFGAATTLVLGDTTGVANIRNATTNILGNATVAGDTTLTGDLAVNGGDITTTAATINLLNDNATTVDAFKAATDLEFGATTGTLTINNPTLVGTQTTQDVFNATATTVNAFGDATSLTIGAISAGYTNIRSAEVEIDGNATVFGALAVTGDTTITGDIQVDGGDFRSNSSSFNLLDTSSTTAIYAFGSATTINIGDNSGTLTINNPTVVGSQTTQDLYNTTATTMNFAGAATTLILGATTGTANIRNATTNILGNAVVGATLSANSIQSTPIGSETAASGKFTSVTDESLTATRVTFAGTGGDLDDSANLTFATDTLSIKDISINGETNTIAAAGGNLNLSASTNVIDGTGATVSNIADPTDPQDAVTLSYLQTQINSGVTNLQTDNSDITITDDGNVAGVITTNVDGVLVSTITTNSASYFTDLLVIDDATSNVSVNGTLYASGAGTFDASVTINANTGNGLYVSNSTAQFAKTVTFDANIDVSGNINATDTTQSTNSTTGAITTSGGVGIAKNLNVGGDVVITGNLQVDGSVTSVNTATLDVEDLNITVAKGAGSSAAADGAGLTVDGAGATLLYTHATTSWDLNKTTRITDTTDATDNTEGALQVVGGLGVGKSIYARDINDTIIGNVTPNEGYFTNLTSTGNTSLGLTQATAINNTPIGNAIASTAHVTSLDASGIVQFTDATEATAVGTGALRVTGGASIGANLFIGGNVNFVGSSYVLTGNYGVFYGDLNGFGALYAGVTGYTSVPQTVFQTSADINNYAQNNFENLNTGNKASTDWVATAGDGNDYDHYINMGITTVNWDGTQDNSLTNAVGANDGYLYVQGNVATGQGGNLTIGSSASGPKTVSVIVGGNTASNISSVFRNPGTESSNTTTGALTVSGGVGVSGNLNANNISIVNNLTTTSTTFNLLNSTATTVNAFGAATTLGIGAGTGTLTLNNATVTTPGQIVTTRAGSATTGNGQIFLNGSTNNRIDWATAGTGAPAFTSRTDGTKVVLYPALSGSTVDYAIGIDSATMWSSVPENTSAFNFKWYGAETLVANLSGTGNFTTVGDIAVNGGDLTTTAGTFNLIDTDATTVNAFGAATTLNFGATTGTLTIGNPTVVGTETTQNLYNTTATTVNFAGAATTVNIGAITGTTTVNNNLDVGLSLSANDINGTVIGNVTPATGAFTSVTDTGLTATRVTYAGTGGLLSDNADFTYDAGILTIQNFSINGATAEISVIGGSGNVVLNPDAGGVIDATGSLISNIANPVSAQDAVTLDYLTTTLAAASANVIQQNDTDVTVTDSGNGTITANVDAVNVFTISNSSANFYNGFVTFTDTTSNVTIDGLAYISGNATVLGELSVAGQVTFSDTTESDFAGGGALSVDGGISAAKSITAGGNLTVDGANVTFGDNTVFYSSYTTINNQGIYHEQGSGRRSIQIKANDNTYGGGIASGDGNGTYVYSATGMQFATGTTLRTSLYPTTLGNIGVQITQNGNLIAQSGTVSTSSSTGALVVVGGVGISDSLFVGNGAVINDTQSNENFVVKGTNSSSLFLADSTNNAVVFGGNLTSAVAGSIATFTGSSAIILPVGDVSQRPSNSGATDVIGMARYSTSSNNIEFFDGSSWQVAGSSFTLVTTNAFTGNGTQVDFTLSAPSTTSALIVSINGVVQYPTLSYTVGGIDSDVLTFTEAPAVGDIIDARALSTSTTVSALSNGNGYVQFKVNDEYANVVAGTASVETRMSIAADTGTATFMNDVVINGNLTVKGDTAGNINLGDANTDNVIFFADINSNVVPNGNEVHNLGAPTARWANTYTDALVARIIVADPDAVSVGTSDVVIDTFDATVYRSAKYVLSISNSSLGEYETAEVLVVHNGTTAYKNQYATMYTGTASLGTVSATYTSGTVELSYQGANAGNAVKIQTTYIKV